MEDKPLRIKRVRLAGNARTRSSVFDNELQEAYRADTLGGVHVGLENAIHGLRGLGIFDEVHVHMDGDAQDAEGIDVTITVKEKNVVKVDVGTFMSNGEGTVEMAARLRNPLGMSETLAAEYVCSPYGGGSTTMNISAATPRIAGLPGSARVSARKEDLNFEAVSSYSERQEGGAFELTDASGQHMVELMHFRRDVQPRLMPRNLPNFKPGAKYASHAVVEQAGPSGKTGLRYTFATDHRDSPVLPTAGSFLRASAEVSQVSQYSQASQPAGGDPSWADYLLRFEANGQRFFPVGPDQLLGQPGPSLGISAAAGLAWGGAGKMTHISDRFFVGGPSSLRGFQFKGVGPRADAGEGGVPGGDALGGDVYFTYGAVLSFPFPHPVLAGSGLRGHIFANAGNLLPSCRSLSGGGLFDGLRSAVGVGLAMATPLGRVEANVSCVLKAQEHDKTQKRQLGIGLSFF